MLVKAWAQGKFVTWRRNAWIWGGIGAGITGAISALVLLAWSS